MKGFKYILRKDLHSKTNTIMYIYLLFTMPEWPKLYKVLFREAIQ